MKVIIVDRHAKKYLIELNKYKQNGKYIYYPRETCVKIYTKCLDLL